MDVAVVRELRCRPQGRPLVQPRGGRSEDGPDGGDDHVRPEHTGDVQAFDRAVGREDGRELTS